MKKALFFFSLLAVVFSFSSTAAVTAVVVPSGNTGERVVPSPDAVKAALAEYRNLSRKEKRERFKLLKHSVKDFKLAKKAGDTDTNTLLMVIVAILLPPLAVYLHEGEINSKFWIDLLLTLLFFVPGMIYALIVVLGKD